MKIVNFKYCTILLFIFCIIVNGKAQEVSKGYKVIMEMNTDEKGDVAVNINVKYNAQNWDVVKQNHGTDPSVLKNIWKKQFPKYQLTEFDIKNDDMERTTNSKFKILGLLKLDESGKWIADLDTKNPDITKVSDNQFLLIDETNAQTLKIILPKSASNAKVEKDNFGKSILTYTAPISGGGGNILKYIGFLIVAGGIVLFFKNRSLNTIVVNNPKHQKIDYHSTKNIDDAVVINQPVKENVKSNNSEEKDQE